MTRRDRQVGDPRSRRGAPTLALVAVLGGLLAFLGLGEAPERTRLWMAVFDAGHAPLFGLIALILFRLIGARLAAGAWRSRLAVFGLTAVVAAASEVLQLLQAHREVSLADLLRDLAGAAAFLLIGAAWSGRRAGGDGAGLSVRERAGAVALGVVLLALAMGELAVVSAVYVARARAVPTLFALDGSWWETRLITAGRSRLIPRQVPPARFGLAPGERLARLDLQPGLYPGLTLDEPYPDWRGYRRLTFVVASDLDVPIALVLRVHDASHDHRHTDRFNQRLTVEPGVNRIEIPIEAIRHAPAGREMDLRRVRGIVLFAYRLRQPMHVYVGPLRLDSE